jgi:hypothetical protein
MALDGDWYNELKSKMVLSVTGAGITGTYHTAVGNATGVYDLVGRIDSKAGSSRGIAFVVSWENTYGNSESVTAWSGEVQVDGQDERILTTWLLTMETDPANNWESTIVGQDVFTRTPPSDADVKARLLRAIPHPAQTA